MRGHDRAAEWCLTSHWDLGAVGKRVQRLAFGTLVHLIRGYVHPCLNERVIEQASVFPVYYTREASHIGGAEDPGYGLSDTVLAVQGSGLLAFWSCASDIRSPGSHDMPYPVWPISPVLAPGPLVSITALMHLYAAAGTLWLRRCSMLFPSLWPLYGSIVAC
jgi:hypothetical protein